VTSEPELHLPCKAVARGGHVKYHHAYYGCDTGCCGYRFVVEDGKGKVLYNAFSFWHGDKAELDAEAARIAAALEIEIGTCEYVENCW
jgi:hypothetical protein